MERASDVELNQTSVLSASARSRTCTSVALQLCTVLSSSDDSRIG